jgi:two-component system phosphate regulon response regulator PhoB
MTPSLPHVLLVDDEIDIQELLSHAFQKAGGFRISTASDGRTALSEVRREMPSLVILDLSLPSLSGLEFLKALKFDPLTRAIPVVILTAKADEVDRLLGFELGATDYVTKPFSPREVVLRVKAILNREGRSLSDYKVRAGNIQVDVLRHAVYVADKAIHLTAVEFKLLTKLMESRGQVLERDHLLSCVWGYERSVDTRTVDTHIRRLRAKLGSSYDMIEAVRGFGYRLNDSPQEVSL